MALGGRIGTAPGLSQGSADGLYLQESLNLSDLDSVSTARTNLGLGSIALLNSIDISSNTNLAVTSPIVLTGDTLSFDQTAQNTTNDARYLKLAADNDPLTGALEIRTTSTQLTLAYDSSNSATFATSSAGKLTITPKAGQVAEISGSTSSGVDIASITQGGVSRFLFRSSRASTDATGYLKFDFENNFPIIQPVAGTGTPGLKIRDQSGNDQITIAQLGGVTVTPNLTLTTTTADTILSVNSSKVVTSLSTATYPSLTELSYVKGVTSAIQTQIDGKQPLDAGLTSISGLTTAADTMIYTTALDTYTTTTLTSFARTLLDDSDAATARTTLGLVAGGTGDIWVEKAGDTMTGLLTIDGSADQIQLIVQGNATQTNNLVVFENSAGSDQFTFSNTGAANFNASANDSDFNINANSGLTNINATRSFFHDATFGHFGLGTGASASVHLNGLETITGTTGGTGFSETMVHSPTGTSSAGLTVLNASLAIRSNQTLNGVNRGIISGINVDTTSGATIANLQAGLFQVAGTNGITGTLTVASGIRGIVTVADLTTGTAIGADFTAPATNNGVITSGIGFRVIQGNITGTGSITTNTGISIGDFTNGGTDFAINTGAGNIVFNENGDADTDFRVEGDTATNLFLTDAGINAVQIGTTTAGAIADFRPAEIVFNDTGLSTLDFRVESDAYDALFVDASNDATYIMNNGSGKISFFAVTPVTRQTELTDELTTITFTAPGTPDYAIQDLTNAGGFGFVTKDEGNTVLSVIANLQTRVNELETKLTNYGLLIDAD